MCSPPRRKPAMGRADPLDRWSRRVLDALGDRFRRPRLLPLRRAALLAVSALGDARGRLACLAAGADDPCRARALGIVSRRARFRASGRRAARRRAREPLRELRGAALPDRLSRRRVFPPRATIRRSAPPISERRRAGIACRSAARRGGPVRSGRPRTGRPGTRPLPHVGVPRLALAQSITAACSSCCCCAPPAAAAAALGRRISTSSGKAASETKVMIRKSLE